MGELQEKIDAVDGWTLDNQLEIAMDALRCPPGDCRGRQPLGRREAPRRADPAAAREARHPAARRADQPSRRRERRSGWKSTSNEYAGNVILVTHDRYFLDNVVNWVLELDRGRYLHLRRQLFRLSWRRRPSAWSRRSARSRASRRRSTTSSNGSASSPKARQTKSKARIRAFDELVEAQENRTPGKAQILIQVPERLGGNVIDAQGRLPRPMATSCCSRI